MNKRLFILISAIFLLFSASVFASDLTAYNVTSSTISNQSAILGWDTVNLSNSSVKYGTTPSLAGFAFNSSNVTQGHRVSISSLTPNTFYFYNVSSCNATACVSAGMYNFTTDDKPTVSNVITMPVTPILFDDSQVSCYATVFDAKNTTLTVEYWWYNGSNPTAVISGNKTDVNISFQTLISTLTPNYTSAGETWNCTVRAYDGNYYSLYSAANRTLGLRLENVSNSSITNESVIISWDTPTASNSSVGYNTSMILKSFGYNTSYVKIGHSILLSGLMPNTFYYYNISSCTSLGYCMSSNTGTEEIIYNFTTDGPPIISNIANTSLTNESAIISWDATKNSSTFVEYGTADTTLSNNITNSTNVTTGHAVKLTGLQVGTTYYYNVTSCNQYGCDEEGPYNFATTATPSACGNLEADTTLVNDVYVNGSCYSILNNSVTLNCAGYSIIGNSSGTGISMNGLDDITLRDCIVINFTYGIYSNYSNISLRDNFARDSNTLDYYFNNSNVTFQSNTIINETQTVKIDNSYVSSDSSKTISFIGNSINYIEDTTFYLETLFGGDSINTIRNSGFINSVTFEDYTSISTYSATFYYLTINSENDNNLVIENFGAGNNINKYINSSTNNFEINLSVTDITTLYFYAKDDSFNKITDSSFSIVGAYNSSNNQYINSTISSLRISVNSESGLDFNNFLPGTINKNISSSTTTFETYLNNTIVSDIRLTLTGSSAEVYESVINTISLTSTTLTAGNNTNISTLSLYGTSVANFTTHATITSSIVIDNGNSILDGLIDMPSSITLSGSDSLMRYFPTYVMNESGLPNFNSTILIKNGSTVVWNQTTNALGYIKPRINFTDENQNTTYELWTDNTSIYSFTLLTDTPINTSTDTTAPNITNHFPKGIITTTDTQLKIWTDEPSTCKYDISTGISYDDMGMALEANGLLNQMYISGLTNGDKQYYIRCRDVSGNIGSEFAVSFTVSVYYRSGGGGMFIPKAPPENPKSSHYWTSILDEGSTTMRINHPEIAFTKLIFSINTNLEDVEITVEKLLDEPDVSSKLGSIVYQFIEISKENLKVEDFEIVTIKFKVDKDWLDQNDINQDSISLYKFTNQWVKLKTKRLNTESGVVHYEAKAPSFSLFAISTPILTTKKPIQQQNPTITDDIEEIVVETIETDIELGGSEDRTELKIILFVIVLMVVLIAIGVGIASYINLNKKRETIRVEQYLTSDTKTKIDLPELEKPIVKHPELESYISKCLAINMNMTEIRNNLVKVGWDAQLVDQAIGKFL